MEELKNCFSDDAFFEDDFEPLPEGVVVQDELVREKTSYIQNVWHNFKKNKLALISAIILLVLILLVIFGPMMNQYDYASNDYSKINMPPNADNWFGTDAIGRDLWTRVWVGGRVSLLIALLSTAVSYTIGMLIGGVSGYYGGRVDMILMRIIDVLSGIPDLIYMTLLMLVLGAGNIGTLVIAMSVTGWMSPARAIRGQVLQLKQREFVIASKTLGASPMRLIFKHLIPNFLGNIVVGMSMFMPSMIFDEAFLSYIGLGITPPHPSWGQLIKSAADSFRYYPYQFLIPCILISLTMLCFYLMGDGLRDALDPKLRK